MGSRFENIRRNLNGQPQARVVKEYPEPEVKVRPGQYDDLKCSNRALLLAQLAFLSCSKPGSVTTERLYEVLDQAISQGTLPEGPDWQGLSDMIHNQDASQEIGEERE